MLFGAFFTAYFFIRVVNPSASTVDAERWQHWLPCKEALVNGVCQAGYYQFPVFVAGVNTAILVTSSFTVHWATQAIKRGDRNGLRAGLVLTILLGSAFLLTQMVEYSHVGFNLSDGAFASAFFGLSLLAMAAVRSFRGHYSPEHHHGVEIPGIYWHFVDVMWIIVYFTVYIL